MSVVSKPEFETGDDGKGLLLHQKCCERIGVLDLTEVIAKAPFRDLIPVLIQAWRTKSAARKAADLVRDYVARKQFYGVSDFDQRELHRLTSLFYSVLPTYFRVVELSPIAPLGVNSVITKLSQDISLPTIRGSEVVSDPTTALALECAASRKELCRHSVGRSVTVNLATTHRILRMQPFDSSKGYMQHFRGFGLFSGGRDDRSGSFTARAIVEHISIWLDLIHQMKGVGYRFRDVIVGFSDIRLLEHLIGVLSLPRERITLNSMNDDFDILDEYGIDLPKWTDSVCEVGDAAIEGYGLSSKLLDCLSLVEKHIVAILREKYPNVKIGFDFSRKSGLGYYRALCYNVLVTSDTDQVVSLADGGEVGWLEQLLSDKKESSLSSGFGAELAHKLFAPQS